METVTSNQQRSTVRGNTLGGQKRSVEKPSAVSPAPTDSDITLANRERGNSRSAPKEKVRRGTPQTDRNNPATKQLIDWVDTVGVKRAAEELGEYPSVIKRWGVSHIPTAKHLESFQGLAQKQAQAEAEYVNEGVADGSLKIQTLSGKGPKVQVPTEVAADEEDEDIEYVDNRPIEDATPLVPDDPKKLEEVKQFSHARISKPSAIKANLIKNGKVVSTPINTIARAPQPVQPKPIVPIHNEEIGGIKVMTEQEYKELLRTTRDPVNSPTVAPQPQRQQPPLVNRAIHPTNSKTQVDDVEEVESDYEDDAQYAPRKAAKAKRPTNSQIDSALDWMEQNTDQLSTDDLGRMRNIFFPWQGKKVFLAFPVIKLTNPATAWAIAQLMRDLGDKGGGDLLMGNSNIDHARNILSDKFMKSKSEFMLFIDDDVVPPTGRPNFFNYVNNTPDNYPKELASVHVVEQLLSHNKTLVGGFYFGRQAKGAPMFHEGLTVKEAHLAARNTDNRELRATEWFATGCMMIHRSVFEGLMATFPKLKVDHEDFEWDFFQKIPGSGEDASFCRRAKQAGHQPYVDLSVRCAHVGFCAWGSWNTDSNIR